MARVLVVDDEKLIVKGIRFSLEQDGMEVDCAYDGEEAIELAKKTEYDIVLLDVMLPKYDGYEVCQAIREFSDMPIIMLTAKNSEYDRVIGLDHGADDFVSKPFSMLELIARIRAVLRRAEPAQTSGDFSLGLLFVSPDRHEVKVGGKDVMLTNKEFELLCLLLRNKGIVLTRATLMDRVWGFESERENRTLDVHIRTLRVKLGEAGSYIETVRGIGYKIGGEDLCRPRYFETRF